MIEKKAPSKTWKIKSSNGTIFEFYPTFIYDGKEDKIKCNDVMIKVNDKEHWFNFLNLYMFVYFVANEELRQSLALRYERQINYIPYDVLFKLSPEEKKEGIVKRRIELPVDQLAMAIARNEAFKLKSLKDKVKQFGNKFYRK